MRSRNRSIAAFSLVELSIVLVILGLLVGGVLGGQSLVKAAELRAVTNEYEQWLIAVNTFKQKYNALPGDFNLATRFWSGTWDGNNDGILDEPTGGGQQGEWFTLWQQLALAGLINGEFTGRANSGSKEDSAAGVNVPASRYTSAGWSMYYIGNWDESDQGFYITNYGNMFMTGGKIQDWEYGLPIFTPEQAWNIDRKIDDGIPSRGRVMGRNWSVCGQAVSGATTAANLNTQYALSTSTAACTLVFLGV